MNHAHLRAFHAVASYQSFTKAATVLHLTQPTLSGQVKALETQYGVRLFERRGRVLELTELGRSLFEGTQRLFALEADLEQQLSAARELTTGELRVGADAPFHIIPLMAAFTRRYPGITISLAFGNSEQLLQGLRQRQYDLAVLPGLQDDSRFCAVPLRPDRLVVFVDRGHPWAGRRSIKLRELTTQRIILRETGSTTRAIFENTLREYDLQLTQVLEIGSREGVREAVAAGLGVGIVAESEFGTDNRVRALRVQDARLESIEYVVCLVKRRPARVVSAFFDMLPGAGK
ncbi:MAG: LysR substrate-binding domain-containing protein [Gammaproteobacteria bacterium]